MPGVSFILDDAALAGALGRLGQGIAHPAETLDAIGAHFVFSTQRNIEQETAPDGSPWPRLSVRTAAQRSGRGRRGFDHMLRVTTRLYKSIAYEVTSDGVEWGSNLQYARIHQLGGVVDRPARDGRVSLKNIRRKGGGVRTRFVRAGTKGATEKVVGVRAHQVRIPARPYLGISAADREAVPRIVADELQRSVGR